MFAAVLIVSGLILIFVGFGFIMWGLLTQPRRVKHISADWRLLAGSIVMLLGCAVAINGIML